MLIVAMVCLKFVRFLAMCELYLAAFDIRGLGLE